MLDILAAVAGNILGAKTAQWLGGDGKSNQPDIGAQITSLVNGMNDNLKVYLDKALNTSTDYTNRAMTNVKAGEKSATTNLQNYLKQGQQLAERESFYPQMQSRAAMAPFMQAGNTALDSYMDSLGLSRPVVGYNALQDALLKKSDKDYAMSKLGPAVANPGQAPGAYTPGDLNTFLQNNPVSYQQALNYANKHVAQSQEKGGTHFNYYTGYGSNKPEYAGWNPYGITDDKYGWARQGGWHGWATNASDSPMFMGGSGFAGTNKLSPLLLGLAKEGAAREMFTQQEKQAKSVYDTNLAKYNQANQAYQDYSNQVNQVNSQFGTSPLQQMIINAQQQGLFNR